MQKIILLARIGLAIPFLVFGLDGLIGFLPPDLYPEHRPLATKFLEAITESGYLWELLKILEVAVAIALIVGRFVPLALVVLAPILVNILGFHFTMEPEGTVMALILSALSLFLAWAYRDAFKPLLNPNARPTVG